MTEKALTRRLFRLLLDVVDAVTEATGFARGLFTEKGCTFAFNKTVALTKRWLEKLIKLIAMQLISAEIDAMKDEILGGIKATKTNRILQLLALVHAAAHAPNSHVLAELPSRPRPWRNSKRSTPDSIKPKWRLGYR